VPSLVQSSLRAALRYKRGHVSFLDLQFGGAIAGEGLLPAQQWGIRELRRVFWKGSDVLRRPL
jgi:hypothetical protein